MSAVQALAKTSPELGLDLAEWTNQGLASSSRSGSGEPADGSLRFVKHEDGRLEGQMIVVPAGSGWRVSTIELCR